MPKVVRLTGRRDRRDYLQGWGNAARTTKPGAIVRDAAGVRVALGGVLRPQMEWWPWLRGYVDGLRAAIGEAS